MATDSQNGMTTLPKTVAVTGANGHIGRMLLPRLQAVGMTTLALVRKPTALEGADEIITDWMNNPAALTALARADAIVHLTGELFLRTMAEYVAANVTPTERIVQAMQGSRVRRVVTLSYLGADASSSNDYLKTNGQREQLLIKSGVPTVVFRCPFIINTPTDPGSLETALMAPPATNAVRTIGSGRQRHRPVYRGDVVAAIVPALQGGQPGIYDLVGPAEITSDGVIRMLNRNRTVRIEHTPGWLARIASRFMPDLPPTYVDLALRDSTGDPARTVREFGLTLTDLHTVWQS